MGIAISIEIAINADGRECGEYKKSVYLFGQHRGRLALRGDSEWDGGSAGCGWDGWNGKEEINIPG